MAGLWHSIPSLSHNQRGEIWRPSSPWGSRPLYPIGGKLAYQNEMGLSQPACLPPESCSQVPETSFPLSCFAWASGYFSF